MKKSILIVIAALLLAIFQQACAQSEFPQDMWELYVSSQGEEEFTECFFFNLPDGSRMAAIISPWGNMGFYRCVNGEWRSETQFSPGVAEWNISFIRHNITTPRADGSFYPDELGFDMVNTINGDYIAYHYDGEYMIECGWRRSSEYQGHVILDGYQLSYYPDGAKEAEATFTLDDDLFSWIGDFDDLPGTPKTAQQLVNITEASVANLFPGYALRHHSSYNHGYETEASYSKIEDGCLYIKRVVFTAEHNDMYVVDTMPVPLSAELLKRLETEPFNELISTHGASDVFLVDNALDLDRVPVPGVIVESDVQENALILLTRLDENTSQIHIVTLEDGTYSVASSKLLPGNVYMDIFHSDEDEISLEWNGQAQQAGFQRMADGTWQLEWVMNSGAPSFDYNVEFCGVTYEWTNQGTDGVYIGSLSSGMDNLLTIDLNQLPTSMESLISLVDPDGWAVVNNPNPADRLHLRVEPKRGAKSLGKFYNGTPVQVHETEGDWCRVSIGLDGHLEGWMMKEYLAFGEQMQDVDCVFPQLGLKEEHQNAPAYADQDMDGNGYHLNGTIWITGVVDDELYVILTNRGETGYMPQEWFWAGNG